MAHNMTKSYERSSRGKSKSSRSVTVTPPSSPVHASSPPPAIVDQLDIFLELFGKANLISPEVLATAGEKLREARFMPEAISEASVTLDRLKELTGFAEGELHALKKFAREWSSKIAVKRAKRNL